jgi:4-amino-4-deoxy-L-arabinose transferase-like glycosyltransferase
MAEPRRFGLPDWLLFVLTLALAAGVRAGYLATCADQGRNGGPLAVQDPERTELDALVRNLKGHQSFQGPAPFAEGEEPTAHRAPGYPWLLSGLARVVDAPALDGTVRWLQCGLGALTAGLYFLFARRAFRSLLVAALAGLACALHPFQVIDTAAVADGVLASFLLALALVLGCRAGQTGGPFASLVYGLALAGLALVRAALLPFAFVALAWLLLRSRRLPRGWLAALLAFLGFANGLAPWTVRNLQAFHEPVPVVDSAWLHLWVGNNPHADGGPRTREMEDSAPPGLKEVQPQPERYARLAGPVWEEVRSHPAQTLRRRLQAGLAFVFGADWFKNGRLAEETSPGAALPDWLARSYPAVLQGTLLALLLLAALGWRWSYGWRWESLPASLALIWVPLPYLLSHAEALSGPRLPLDGVLLCYATFALACLVPGVGQDLLDGPREDKGERQG